MAIAIDLYSTVRASPSDSAGVLVEADIPLNETSLKELRKSLSNATMLANPLRLAAESTLEYLGQKTGRLAVDVECEIPIGAGLGSSASISVAIISCVAMAHGVGLDKREISKIAFTPENVLHGKSSGVDQATCAYGGIIRFQRPFNVRRVSVKRPPTFLVCDTGIHHSTKNLVGAVLKKSKREISKFEKYVSQVKEISGSAIRALESNDSNLLGSLMYENHELLRHVGVSHPMLDKLVDKAKAAGALGAKMTGAGGGGCILALCEDNKDRARIARILHRQGGRPYMVSIDPDGVESFPAQLVRRNSY